MLLANNLEKYRKTYYERCRYGRVYRQSVVFICTQKN